MTNILRKIALPTTIALFCVLIGLNAYVASKSVRLIQGYAAQRAAASDFRSDIVALKLDLDALESGQQGYLLTGDEAYLAPYTQASGKLPGDFSTLRSRLAARPAHERALESALEEVTQSKIAEAEETIRLRRKDLRHRAFLMVASNRGKELMDRARSLLDQLAQVQTQSIAQYDGRLKSSISEALEKSLLGSGILLALSVLALFGFDQRSKRLERAFDQRAGELRATRAQLDRFTSTISGQLRPTLRDLTGQAEMLLNSDGGFLPRTGQERAQWIHEASGYVSRALDNLLDPASAVTSEEAHPEETAIGESSEADSEAADDAAEHPKSRTA